MLLTFDSHHPAALPFLLVPTGVTSSSSLRSVSPPRRKIGSVSWGRKREREGVLKSDRKERETAGPEKRERRTDSALSLFLSFLFAIHGHVTTLPNEIKGEKEERTVLSLTRIYKGRVRANAQLWRMRRRCYARKRRSFPPVTLTEI